MSHLVHEHDVHDRVIVLAGAGGLATATAARLGRGGAKLVIGDLHLAAAESAAEAARSQGGEARAVQLDISDEASVNALIAHAMSEFGRIDGLLNIAADISPQNLGRDTDAVEIPLEVWQHSLDVNLTGYLLTPAPRSRTRSQRAAALSSTSSPAPSTSGSPCASPTQLRRRVSPR